MDPHGSLPLPSFLAIITEAFPSEPGPAQPVSDLADGRDSPWEGVSWLGLQPNSAVSSPGLAFSGVTSECSDLAMDLLSDEEQLFQGLAQGGPQVPSSCSPSPPWTAPGARAGGL